MAAKRAIGFFNLPQAFREEVYRYLFTQSEPLNAIQHKNRRWPVTPASLSSQFFQCSKACLAEGRKWLYGVNHFNFPSTAILLQFIKAVGKENFSNISRLTINVTSFKLVTAKMLAQLKNLELLRIQHANVYNYPETYSIYKQLALSELNAHGNHLKKFLAEKEVQCLYYHKWEVNSNKKEHLGAIFELETIQKDDGHQFKISKTFCDEYCDWRETDELGYSGCTWYYEKKELEKMEAEEAQSKDSQNHKQAIRAKEAKTSQKTNNSPKVTNPQLEKKSKWSFKKPSFKNISIKKFTTKTTRKESTSDSNSSVYSSIVSKTTIQRTLNKLAWWK